MRIEPVIRTAQRIGPILTEVGKFPDEPDRQLDIELELQKRNNWCWSAVSCAIAAHYSGPLWSQEDIAWRILSIDSLKADSAPPAEILTDPDYDQQASLERVLRYVNCLAGWSGGRPPFRRLMREIDRGRPMAVAIRWGAGPQHYVLIDGYDRSKRTLSVADPQTGRSIVSFDHFPETYREGGEWMETYWTDSPSRIQQRQQGEFQDE